MDKAGNELIDGLVVKTQSGFYTVHTEQGELVCRLPGRMKKSRKDTDLVAVGDQVHVSLNTDGTGVIEAVEPRERAMTRLARQPADRRWDREGYLAEREQVILANPDQIVFVFACAEPEPHLRMFDRLLVGAAVQNIPAIVCANKIDLIGAGQARRLFGVYKEIGYPIIYTSATKGVGVKQLRQQLCGKVSALIGQSGAGKSSLLNAVQPGLGLAVQEISQSLGKGRHTTVVTELFRLDQGGWVADTPGLRTLALFDVDPEELDAYFPDIAPFVSHCAFSDCTHTVEPGCAVQAAVDDGRVYYHRYESYVRLRDEHQRLADMYWWGIRS